MNRYTPLLDTADFAVGRFDHPGEHPHYDPAEEVSSSYSVSLVERGDFCLQVGRRSWELSAGSIFLSYPGLVYRCRHRDHAPADVCMTACYFQPEAENPGFPEAVQERPVVAANNRLAYLFRRLSLKTSPDDLLQAEESAWALLAEVCSGPAPTRRLHPPHQLRWYAERIDAARSRLDMHYDADHSLSSLARSAGMSTFHFARVFRELAGVPPHRYLLRVRLADAARRLRQGASVTEACFRCGFHNLSHFIRIFHRHFGASPAKYARGIGYH